MEYVYIAVSEDDHRCCDNCNKRTKKLIYCIDDDQKVHKFGIECAKKLLNEKQLNYVLSAYKNKRYRTLHNDILYAATNKRTKEIASTILEGRGFHCGKYKGKCLRKVAKEDLEYVKWFYTNFKSNCEAIDNAYRKRLGNIIKVIDPDFELLYDFAWPPKSEKEFENEK